MKTEMIQEFQQEMDARGVGDENYFNSKAILDKMDQFGKELLEKLGDKSTSDAYANFVSISINLLLNPANLDGPVASTDFFFCTKTSMTLLSICILALTELASIIFQKNSSFLRWV